MNEVIIERLKPDEIDEFKEFCETHWGQKHPLIHHEQTFNYYFVKDDGINFVCARDALTKQLLSVAGFIKTNSTKNPDVFVSYLVAKKGAPITAALKTVDMIRKITNSSQTSVNNIRETVFGFYKFLKFNIKPLSQFYRLNDRIEKYTICSVERRIIPKVYETSFEIREISSEEVEQLNFNQLKSFKPFKDKGYIKWRYIENPWFLYEFIKIEKNGAKALVVYRIIQSEGGKKAVRIVDFLGDTSLVLALGQVSEMLFSKTDAEFVDFSCVGFSEQTMFEAGFVLRTSDDTNIIPVYLTPIDLVNVDFFSASDSLSDWFMFKADGDQDRPNITL